MTATVPTYDALQSAFHLAFEPELSAAIDGVAADRQAPFRPREAEFLARHLQYLDGLVRRTFSRTAGRVRPTRRPGGRGDAAARPLR